MSDELTDCGWTKLWHKRGPQVTIPLRGDITTFDQQVSYLLDQGWLVAAPGLEQGEYKGDCGAVVRGNFEGQRGTVPIVDLYLVDDRFAKVRVYLDTQEDVDEFERASGLKLSALPVYIGVNKLERGKSKQTDSLFVDAPKPFGIVWKDNPKYDPKETDTTKKKPARLFVRWVDQKPSGTPTPAQEPPKQPEWTNKPVSQKTRDKLDQKPSMEETTKLASWWINEAKPDHAERQGSLDAIGVYANERGWVWYEGKYEPAPF